jgi:thioredoxin reductase
VQPAGVQSGNWTEVAIIGAGPYGLSIAAHLAARGISFRIFGTPMTSWSEHMPKGMQLKSEGFASSLSDPKREFTLRSYCAREGAGYKDIGLPVKLETFVAYGLAFQKRFVPNLEEKLVTRLEQVDQGFQLVLDNHEKVFARNVVVATGITNFARIPQILRSLPAEAVTHSWDHSDLGEFRGRRVAVIGAGASALDTATLLYETGADVHLIARSSTVRFHEPPSKKTSLRSRLKRPVTPIGPGLDLLFYANAPGLFRLLPESVRLEKMSSVLGPAPGWFVKNRIAGKIPFHLGVDIASAIAQNGSVKLELSKDNAQLETVEVDHVIAATGYRVDLERLEFLDSNLRGRIQLTGGSPLLSATCESTVPGIYFVGLPAANSFGPLLRFACGAGFAARRVSKHLSKRVPRAAGVPAAQKLESYGNN